MPLEAVPALQKAIIGQANHAGKLVITATQMLDSMIRSPRPTRAEASDVVNAIVDGTDVVMLSGETASGKYPGEAVSVLRRLIDEAEDYAHMQAPDPAKTFQGGSEIRATICQAAVASTQSMPIAAIFVHTHSGKIGRYMSKFRPQAPIFALTPNEKISQRCAVFWGVTPYAISNVKTTTELIRLIDRIILRMNLDAKKSVVAIVSGFPFSQHVSTNMLKLHEVKKR
jgi:pyruvate kinase